ncbi:MAG: energy transducer TonB, partial [Rhodothermales bacterium]
SLVVVLLCANLSVRLWPAHDARQPQDVPPGNAGELIHLEEVAQTSHGAVRPPPPPPPIPIVASEEIEWETPDLDFEVALPDPSKALHAGLPGSDTETSAGGPSFEEDARPIRFVEPEYTREARRRGLRAEIVVVVRVAPDGQVVDTEIIRRYLLEQAATKRPTDEIGYGLEEAAVAAAQRWLFRPARVNGRPVESVYELTFSFGV